MGSCEFATTLSKWEDNYFCVPYPSSNVGMGVNYCFRLAFSLASSLFPDSGNQIIYAAQQNYQFITGCIKMCIYFSLKIYKEIKPYLSVYLSI